MLGTGYFNLSKSQNLVPAKQKNRQSAKTISRKNFVPHTVYMVRRIGSWYAFNLYLPHRKADIKAILNPSYTSGNDTNNILFLNIFVTPGVPCV